jgi:serine/threonine protein phosphatase 1
MIYAVGDIHGHLEKLENALRLIELDGGPDAQIVFVGDYTDRGLESRQVIDRLMEGQAQGRNWICLLGNHDKSFADFVQFGITHDPMVTIGINWLQPRLGGMATLNSYGIISDTPAVYDHPEGELEQMVSVQIDGKKVTTEGLRQIAEKMVPAEHIAFLNNLPLIHETDDLIFVHAGLRPNVPLGEQDPIDLIWIREGFLETGHDFGKLVVHGHTAIEAPQHFGNRIDLDGGAGRGRPLVPAVFEGRDCWLLTDDGRVPLLP